MEEQLDQGRARGWAPEPLFSLALLSRSCGGAWEGQTRRRSGSIASCSRIQNNYMSLQRINRELEQKLYRMVRTAPPPYPLPPSRTLIPGSPALAGH